MSPSERRNSKVTVVVTDFIGSIPNEGSTDDSFQAFCDMETEGGGWKLISTKVFSSFVFIKTTFSASAAKTTDADAASHIHPRMGDWEEKLSGKGEEAKMFRLFLALSFVFILGTFVVSKNQSGSRNGTEQIKCGKSVLKDSCSCLVGRDGRDGQNGKDGRDGRDGKVGTKGDKGERGPMGNDGMNGLKGVKGEQGFHGKDGINGTKGQKGETGPAGKSPQGAIKFGDTAEKCSLRTAGTVRYNASQNALQLCDGSVWLPLVTGGKGHVASRPGRHCMDILKSGDRRGSGLYWIDPNGGSTGDSFQAFCDMETENGGWTLVSTKVSPSFISIKTAFSASAAKSTDTDAASHIHPDMRDWKEVMFRFNDVNTIRVIYNRKAGAPNKDKTEFENLLMGRSGGKLGNVFGFFKYSPADRHKKTPAVGFARLRLDFRSGRISEYFRDSDKWIDMWTSVDGSDNYVTSDDRRARGTKCIAGYCYLNKPIWVMVR